METYYKENKKNAPLGKEVPIYRLFVMAKLHIIFYIEETIFRHLDKIIIEMQGELLSYRKKSKLYVIIAKRALKSVR